VNTRSLDKPQHNPGKQTKMVDYAKAHPPYGPSFDFDFDFD